MSESFCLTENLNYYLSLNDIHIKPEVIFALAEVMGTTYNKNPEFQFEMINGRNGTYEAMIEKFSNVSGINLSGNICNDNFSCDLPLLIEVDDFYLDYHPFFNRNHYRRLVVVLGANERYVEIYDLESRKLDKELFDKAVSGNVHFYVLSNVNMKFGENEYLNAIKNISLFNLSNFYENNIHTGYEGIDIFFADLEQRVRDLSDDDFADMMYDIFFQLNRPGGIKNTREMFSLFLEWLSDEYNIQELATYSKQMKELSSTWESMANLFYKVKITRKRDYILNTIYKFTKEIVSNEKDILSKLLELVDNR